MPKIVEHIEASMKRPLIEAVLSYLPNHPHFEGMVMGDIAESMGMGLGEALCQLLLEEDLQIAFWGTPPDSVNVWEQVSRDSQDFLGRPDFMVGSDSIHVGSFPHPRAYGTFPRFIGRLRRRFNVLTLETVIQRVTDNPARRFGLTGRGRIEEGYFADVVVFDADRIIDTATFDDPVQHPVGIPYVLVNGQVAVDGAKPTGVLAGQPVP